MSQSLLVGPPEKVFTRGASNEVVIEVEGNDTEVVISVDLDSPGPSPSVKQVFFSLVRIIVRIIVMSGSPSISQSWS